MSRLNRIFLLTKFILNPNIERVIGLKLNGLYKLLFHVWHGLNARLTTATINLYLRWSCLFIFSKYSLFDVDHRINYTNMSSDQIKNIEQALYRIRILNVHCKKPWSVG